MTEYEGFKAETDLGGVRFSVMDQRKPKTRFYMRQFAGTAILIFTICFVGYGQKSDTVRHRNIIRLDLTSNFVYSEAFILSYERVVKPDQTFVITAGSEKFPTIASFGDHIKVKDDRKRVGVKIGAEYRFYLKKENKYHAPHGVYVGPYVSYHNFHNDRLLSLDSTGTTESEASFDARLNVLNIGAQLGYQFIIGNRWAIDLMFIGPSISRYSAKLNLDGDLADFQLDDAQKEIVEKLINRFPLLQDILNEDEVTLKGSNSAWAAGWRYQFQVGYYFGRKRK